jgi:hypothetical protein
MNDLPLWAWLIGLVVLLSWLAAAAAITHLVVAYTRCHDMKEFWYTKYSEEHQMLERYRSALKKGEFNA